MDKITGTIKRVTYQNAENGYCVLKVIPDVSSQSRLFDKEKDSEDAITVTGSLQMLKESDRADFSGEWKQHAKYGEYLDVKNFHLHSPTSIEGLKKFLATSRFKGIGGKTAEALVDKFGEKLPEIIENNIEKLTKIKGITQSKAELIQQAWNDSVIERETMISLQGIGLTPNLSQKLIDRYQKDAVKIIRENPYQLAQEVWGVGFSRADEIAKTQGFEHDHASRIQAGIRHALQQALENGHMYLPMNELIEQAQQLLGVNNEPLVKEITVLLNLGNLILDQKIFRDAVYLDSYYELETKLAEQLKNLSDSKNKNRKLAKIRLNEIDTRFEEIEKEQGFKLAHEQKQAVQMVLKEPVSIVTGGPGTGKSTVINTMVGILDEIGVSVSLAAPTGRAAKRMAEVSGRTALTLHRLLKLKPGEPPVYAKDNPLQYDVVIVDEASMLDSILGHYLVQAIKPGTHLVLVGDADQLPSVQAGNVLADLIGSGRFPVVKLQTIFRQAQQSVIITNAHKIKLGHFPSFPDHPTDFYLFPVEDLESASREIVELVTTRIPVQFGYNPKTDIQVLSPLYKTVAGVGELNKRLQDSLNPRRHTINELNFGYQSFREGDRVMQLKNDYEKEVFNGDMGFVTGIQASTNKKQITVGFSEGSGYRYVEYEGDDLRELTLAYAISVHKSQGSEYPVVVMPVLTSHYIMLQRNLLYTAVTRAKEMVVLVGSKKAIFIALNNDKPQQRYSGLKERLRETS